MATLTVKVVPGSSRNRIVGRYGDALKIQVSAPPERGKANQAVIELLAETLNLPANQIELVSGASQPRKTFRIPTLDQPTLDARLAAML